MESTTHWHVILIMALSGLAYAMMETTQTFLLEQALCRAFYAASNPDAILSDGSVPESMCKTKQVQSELAVLSGMLNLSILIAGFLAAPVYTRLASIIGKRRVLIINAVSLTLRITFYSSIFYLYEWFNVRIILLSCAFDLVGGGIPVREILLQMYMQESVPTDRLSNVFYISSATLLGMISLGTFMSSLMLKANVWLLCFICTCVFGLCIPAIYLLPHKSPCPMDRTGSYTSLGSASSSSDFPETASVSSLIADELDGGANAGTVQRHRSLHRTIIRAATVDLYLSIVLLIETVQDPLTRRVMVIFFINTLAMSIHVIQQQWASSAFNWSLAGVNTVNSIGQVVSAVVLIGLPFLSDGILRPLLVSKQQVDLWVMIASTAVNMGGYFFQAISPSMLVYGMGLVINGLGVGMADSLRSFATSALLDDASVQRLYMGARTVQSLAAILGTPLWANILSLALRSDGKLPTNLPYFGASSLFFLSLSLSISLRRYGRSLYR